MAEVKQEVKIIKKADYPLFSLVQRDDGIVMLTTSDNLFLTIRDVRAFEVMVARFTNRSPHLLLIIPGRHTSIDKDFRTYMASKDALPFSMAIALVLRNMSQRTIANLFVGVDKPSIPIKFFDNTKAAIDWLKTQKY